MSWESRQQELYMPLVEESYRFARKEVKKMISDAGLVVTSGQHFNLEDALAEAFRFGAIKALLAESEQSR